MWPTHAYLADAMGSVLSLDERPRRPVHFGEKDGAGGGERDGDARRRDGEHGDPARVAVLEVVHAVVPRLARCPPVDLDVLHIPVPEERRYLF